MLNIENKIKFAGLIYGDGYIKKNGRVCFKHSIIQKEYALFKSRKCLEYFGLKSSKYKQKKLKKSFSSNDNFIIECHAKNWTKLLRQEWYNKSRKQIPPEILSQFGFEEWSFVYQDDGRCNKISHYNSIIRGQRVRKECRPYVNRYELCLGFPSNDELEALQTSLTSLDIHSSILKRKDGQRNLSIYRADSKINFYEGIKDYIHNSLLYKVSILPTINYSQ